MDRYGYVGISLNEPSMPWRKHAKFGKFKVDMDGIMPLSPLSPLLLRMRIRHGSAALRMSIRFDLMPSSERQTALPHLTSPGRHFTLPTVALRADFCTWIPPAARTSGTLVVGDGYLSVSIGGILIQSDGREWRLSSRYGIQLNQITLLGDRSPPSLLHYPLASTSTPRHTQNLTNRGRIAARGNATATATGAERTPEMMRMCMYTLVLFMWL